MSESPGLNTPLAAFVKPIFLKWEKLRLPYNLILFLVTVLWYSSWREGPRGLVLPVMVLFLLIGAVLANICFLAGPLAESYITWLGWKSNLVTGILFVGGVLISIPCVIFFLPFAPMMGW